MIIKSWDDWKDKAPDKTIVGEDPVIEDTTQDDNVVEELGKVVETSVNVKLKLQNLLKMKNQPL